MLEVSHPVRRAVRLPLPAFARRLLARAPHGLVRFLAVGVGGLAVDIAILRLLESHGVGHAGARAVSLGVATVVTWILNRHFTFGMSGRQARAELGRYALVALLAQSVNYLIFLGVCAAWPSLSHSLAAVIGAVAATGFSYSGQRFFTFAPARDPAAPASLPEPAE